MDNFKKQVTVRLRLLIFGLGVTSLSLILSSRYDKPASESEFMQDFISGFQAGIAVALLLVLFFFVIRFARAITNSERLRQLYIIETDERNALIRQKTGSIGMNIANFGLILGTVVAGNINDTAFLTMLAASLFVGLVHAFLKIYYRRKY